MRRRIGRKASESFASPPSAGRDVLRHGGIVWAPFTNEELAGEAPIRDQVVIATKFGWNIDPQTGERRAGLNSRAEHIKTATEGMLKRLKTDHIDLNRSSGTRIVEQPLVPGIVQVRDRLAGFGGAHREFNAAIERIKKQARRTPRQEGPQ